jgi:hypothetical protein
MSGRVYMNFVSGAPVGSTSTTISKGFLVNTVAAGNSAQAILRTLKFFKKLGLGTVTALDSGGFQIFQAETGAIDFTIIYDPSKPMVFGRYLNITPRHCLHTALGTHPNIMFSLDYPVPKEHNKGRQNILFMRNNTFNVRCAREIAAMRDKLCPEIKFFIPLQLYDLDQFDYFMAGLGNINFDGLSLPIRIFSLEKITIFLMKFLKMGIKQAHILGTTRFDVLALLSYFARNYYDFLSVDSTSWRKFATVQVYLRPYSLTSLRLHDEAIIDVSDVNQCECPWCRGKSFSDIKHMFNSDKTMFLCAHNLWVTEQAMRAFYDHAETPESLRDFLMRKTTRIADIKRIYKCLSTIHAVRNIITDDYLKILFRQMCEK